MNILLILLFAGLLGAFLARRRHPQGARVLLVVLVVLSAWVVWLQIGRRDRRPEQVQALLLQTEDAVAERVGEFLAEDLSEGGLVLLLVMDTGSPVTRRLSTALQRGAGDTFEVLAVRPSYIERIMADENLRDAGLLDETLLPFEAWREVSAQHPTAVAIVSTRWTPFLRPGEQTRERVPPVYLLQGAVDLSTALDLMQRGVVRALVRPRADQIQDGELRPGMSVRDVFETRFELLTQDHPDLR